MSPELSSLFPVVLPGGLIGEDGTTRANACLRALNGREEEWLATHSRLPNALAASYLLERCVVTLENLPLPPRFATQMLVGDRDFLILQLRRFTFGDKLFATLPCPACKAKMDVELAISDIEVERRPAPLPFYTITADGHEIRFRLPVGADQEAIASSPATEAADILLARCVLNAEAGSLSQEARSAIIADMERHAPQINLELELACPECGHAFVTPFDTTAFVLEEMRVSLQQLLREVHFLAIHYHWSEADILGMTRSRRRAYLKFLSDALKAE